MDKPKLEPWQVLLGGGIAGFAMLRKLKQHPDVLAGDMAKMTEIVRDMPQTFARSIIKGIGDLSEDYEERKKTIGEGAHDLGASIFFPEPNKDIVVKEHSPGIATDVAQQQHLSGGRWTGSYEHSNHDWTLYESRENYPIIAHFHGIWSPGWRPDCFEAKAITITHAHPDGYFPNRDALYADTLPLDRVAMMLQAAHKFPNEKKRAQVALVVIDNREAHRSEQAALGKLEDDHAILGKNGLRTPANAPKAVIWLGEPDANILYNEEGKASFDPRSGLRLTTREAGDRDYKYRVGVLTRDGEPVAEFSLHTDRCWRPNYGETEMINLNRAWRPRSSETQTVPLDEGDLSINFVAPLLNAYLPLFWQSEHLGNAVIVDTRAEPINYYYG